MNVPANGYALGFTSVMVVADRSLDGGDNEIPPQQNPSIFEILDKTIVKKYPG